MRLFVELLRSLVSVIITDRINAAGNAIASVRLFPFYLRNRLAVDLER